MANDTIHSWPHVDVEKETPMDPEQKYKMGEYVSCALLYNILRNLGNVMTCNRYNVPTAV